MSIICRFTCRFRLKSGPEINMQATFAFDVESTLFRCRSLSPKGLSFPALLCALARPSCPPHSSLHSQATRIPTAIAYMCRQESTRKSHPQGRLDGAVKERARCTAHSSRHSIDCRAGRLQDRQAKRSVGAVAWQPQPPRSSVPARPPPHRSAPLRPLRAPPGYVVLGRAAH